MGSSAMQARGLESVQATPISTRFLTGTFHLNSIFVHHGNFIECDLIYQLSQLEPKKMIFKSTIAQFDICLLLLVIFFCTQIYIAQYKTLNVCKQIQMQQIHNSFVKTVADLFFKYDLDFASMAKFVGSQTYLLI